MCFVEKNQQKGWTITKLKEGREREKEKKYYYKKEKEMCLKAS